MSGELKKVIESVYKDQSIRNLRRNLFYLNKLSQSNTYSNNRDIIKLMAEICYLLALEYKRKGDKINMRKYANKAIKLYKKCNIQELEDSAPILYKLLPDYMHEDVVNFRIFGG